VESDLELVVEDNGEGIDPSFLPHMFEVFRQPDTSTTRPHGGLGIGLSIAKHLVELHGGSLMGESAGKGHGATFVVRIPISPLISATRGVSSVAGTTRKSTRPLPPMPEGLRVLVVDDEPDAQELLAYLMGDCGIEARTVGSAAEAREVLESFTPHVIISDIGMPAEDGYEFVRSIRTSSDASIRDIPAIALTAFTGSAERTRALVSGFNAHIAKPVDASTLLSTIIELSGRGQPTAR
jgi:CheY-like chemotaxis protein